MNVISKNERHINQLRYRLYEKSIQDVFNRLRAGGIEPILLKGWSAGRYYPNSSVRGYGDIDLAIAKFEYEQAAKLIAEEKLNSIVDLHQEFRHLDSLPFQDLFNNSHLVNLHGTFVRVLRPEDNLRVLCVHWLTDGGENRKKLWDIYYAVANRPSNFDWERCLNSVSHIRRKWIISTIALAHRYLSLYIDDLPFAVEIKDSNFIPKWIIKTIEKEWNNPKPLIPLQNCLRNRHLFLQQIKKRLPPNPIQASINTEAPFDESWRLPYQIKDIMYRVLPSIKRFILQEIQMK